MQRATRTRGEYALVLALLTCLLAIMAPHAQAAANSDHPHRHAVTAALGAGATPDSHAGRGDHAIAGSTAPVAPYRPAGYADAAGHHGTDTQYTADTVPARGPPAKAHN